MTHVWIVTVGDYEGYEIEGVHATESGARAWVDALLGPPGTEIEEYRDPVLHARDRKKRYLVSSRWTPVADGRWERSLREAADLMRTVTSWSVGQYEVIE